jgi:hypothetical protein
MWVGLQRIHQPRKSIGCTSWVSDLRAGAEKHLYIDEFTLREKEQGREIPKRQLADSYSTRC